MQNEGPINPLPWVVWLLALPVIALELVFALGQSGLAGDPASVGWRLEALQRFAYSPPLFRAMWAMGEWPPAQVMRIFLYPFVQGSVTQAVFGTVFLLALGKMVAEAFRPWAVLVVFFGAGIVGALAFTAFPPGNALPLFGAYPPVYGLIGAFTFLLWTRLAGSGTQYRAFSLIGLLMGVQLLFAALFGGGFEWVADLAGFATGFLLSFVVSPGGLAQIRARLRQR
ncbi:rhomboid family intramembrane serine protease [Falsirhodobacter algicola]|uniref:Rhomboid family intramembrane serine protease n=1 Tax=Falsirhodobacter algicola TaxID=2692330 RepID=A0A8J8MQT6_9RHOB|nr:rhomboid family intramembrane serine protease [Falsirhodobacter algicola]QUS34824.1 rhomboid family intramembrane serine protease [Falsirhodobacter algicola]